MKKKQSKRYYWADSKKSFEVYANGLGCAFNMLLRATLDAEAPPDTFIKSMQRWLIEVAHTEAAHLDEPVDPSAGLEFHSAVRIERLDEHEQEKARKYFPKGWAYGNL